MKGFTLVELMVTLALLSLVALFGVTLTQAQFKENKRIEAMSQASASIRQFFDLRRRVLQSATNLNFTSFSPVNYLNPNNYQECSGPASASPPCQEVFSNMRIEANSAECDLGVTETIQVECINKNQKVGIINLAEVPGAISDVFGKCAPDCSQLTNKVPRIKVVRECRRTGRALRTTETFFPDGNRAVPSTDSISNDGRDGNPIAAVLCMQIPLGRNLSTYRDFNLSMFMLTRTTDDKYDWVQQTASFPRPKIPDPNAAVNLGPAGK